MASIKRFCSVIMFASMVDDDVIVGDDGGSTAFWGPSAGPPCFRTLVTNASAVVSISTY